MKITITDSSVLPKSITVQESGDVVTVNSVTQPVTVTTDQLTTKIEGAIGDLTDVNITGVTDNQILAYDSATSKWVNEDNSGGAATVDSVNGLTGVVVLDTDDIAEDGAPTNKYFTDARAQTVIDSNSAGFITADSTSTLTNKSGAVSQFTNDAGYLTSETDSQTLSLSSPNLSISGGNSVDLTPLTSGFITASSTDSLTNKSGNISMFTNDSGYSTTTGTVTPTSTDTFTNKSGAISQWTNDSGYTTNTGTVTPTSTDTFTNKSGAISQWTNDSGYLTSETDSQTLSFADPILTISGSLSTVDLSALTPTSLPFSSITSTPTTLAGYGITDSVTGASTTTFTNKSGDISQWTNDSGYSTTTGTVTPSSTDTFTNKSGSNNQWTNDAGYITSAGAGIADVEADTTPTLGGDLDVNDFSIKNTGTGDIGTVDFTSGLRIVASNLRFSNAGKTFNSTISAVTPTVNTNAIIPNHTGYMGLFTTSPTAAIADGTSGQVLTTNGSGALTFTTVSGGSGIAAVVDDTTPQLGGSLDVNGQSIVSVSDGNIAITPDGSGKVILDGLSYPQADGTVGQVIKTDGAGNLSFTTVSGSGFTGDLAGDTLTDSTQGIVINASNGSRIKYQNTAGAPTNGSILFDTYGYESGGTPVILSAMQYRTTAAKRLQKLEARGSTDDGTHDAYFYLYGEENRLISQSPSQAYVPIELRSSQVKVYNGNTLIYKLPTADGSADQVLKTDGGGNLSFTTISASFDGNLNGETLTDSTDNIITIKPNTANNAAVSIEDSGNGSPRFAVTGSSSDLVGPSFEVKDQTGTRMPMSFIASNIFFEAGTATDELKFKTGFTDRMTVKQYRIDATVPVSPGSFNGSSLPGSPVNGDMITISDAASLTNGSYNYQPAFYDGANWRFVNDNSIVT